MAMPVRPASAGLKTGVGHSAESGRVGTTNEAALPGRNLRFLTDQHRDYRHCRDARKTRTRDRFCFCMMLSCVGGSLAPPYDTIIHSPLRISCGSEPAFRWSNPKDPRPLPSGAHPGPPCVGLRLTRVRGVPLAGEACAVPRHASAPSPASRLVNRLTLRRVRAMPLAC